MATDQTHPLTDDEPVGHDRERRKPPKIAHLTVVPANADRSV